MAVLPGSNKSASDHGKHCHFNGPRKSLSARGRKWVAVVKIVYFSRARTLWLICAEETRSFTYFNKSPSNTMVRKILNLLRTVNIGKLGNGKKKKSIFIFKVYFIIIRQIMDNNFLLESLRPK